MNKPKTVITGVGVYGVNIANCLNKQRLDEADFIDHKQLIKRHSENIFILFIIYSTEDYCIAIVDEITGLYKNKTVIEIIITDKTQRQNPHYIINNSSAAVEDVFTLIKAFVDLGRFPTQASVDMADIVDSLKNSGKLQMKELIFEANDNCDVFSQEFSTIKKTKKIKTVWLQLYLQKNKNLLYEVLEKPFDNLQSNLNSEVGILWNVSYEDQSLDKKNKCVLIFC